MIIRLWKVQEKSYWEISIPPSPAVRPFTTGCFSCFCSNFGSKSPCLTDYFLSQVFCIKGYNLKKKPNTRILGKYYYRRYVLILRLYHKLSPQSIRSREAKSGETKKGEKQLWRLCIPIKARWSIFGHDRLIFNTQDFQSVIRNFGGEFFNCFSR